MSTEYFIALDTHVTFCEVAVVTTQGKVVSRSRCDTTIPAIVATIEEVRRPKKITFEEGPLAGWLARNLRSYVDELVVCEPRRNRLIAKDGDKDDAVDAEKLAHLFRVPRVYEGSDVVFLFFGCLKKQETTSDPLPPRVKTPRRAA